MNVILNRKDILKTSKRKGRVLEKHIWSKTHRHTWGSEDLREEWGCLDL